MASPWTRLALRAWSRRGAAGRVLWGLLWPWSVGFRLVAAVRNLLYDVGWLRTRRLAHPVVSVGNLTVGGTGKTPASLWLARSLERDGLRTAILTRGYGSRGAAVRPVRIDPEDARGWLDRPGREALDYGDEAVMLSALYGQTVGVGADRYRAGVELGQEDHGVRAFVLDDGFQHRRVARDLDLVLLGSDCSGSMLPAGPFREPLRALGRADVLIVTGAHDRWRSLLRGRCDASKVFFASLRPVGVLARTDHGLEELSLGVLAGVGVLAVSAVAKPQPFHEMIQECGANIVDMLEFPDHHPYGEGDWRRINRHRNDIEKIVTTEKDFVKLARFPFSTGRLLALRVEMAIDRPEALLDRVREAVRRPAGRGAGGPAC